MTLKRMQQRRGTAASWTSADTILSAGEFGYETDTGKMKVGDGSTAWTSLGYTVASSVTSVAGKAGVVSLVKADVGLGNVDNTTDAAKPVSTAQQTALDAKVSSTRTVTGGGGLTGGGDLTANRVISPTWGATANTVTQGNDARLSDTRTPTDNTVTTAKIVDANVTLAKLSAGVQASLASANTATNVIHVDAQPGANDAERIGAARTALGTDPGVMVFGAKLYVLPDVIDPLDPGQGIVGQGAGATYLYFTGTGDCIRMRDPVAADTMAGTAGPIQGFTLDGNVSGAGSCGIHIGDLYMMRMRDVRIANFHGAASKGLWFDNTGTWCERCDVKGVTVDNCTNSVIFDTHTASFHGFSHSIFNFNIQVLDGQQGVQFLNGASINQTWLRVTGNFEGGAATTGAVLTLANDVNCTIGYGRLEIEVEYNGGSPAHKTVEMGAAASITSECQFEFVGAFAAGNYTTHANFYGFDRNIETIQDVYGHTAIEVDGDASAVNYWVVSNAAAGNVLELDARGTDSNISMLVGPKGTGWLILWANSQTAATLAALGSLTDVDFNIVPKGAGRLKDNGSPVFTDVSVHAATSKTTPVDADELPVIDSAASNVLKKLTWANLKATIKTYIEAVGISPRVGTIKDINGNSSLLIDAAASAVNYLEIVNAATGGSVQMNAAGTDSNINMLLVPKGNGWLILYANSETSANLQALGSQTNIDFIVWPKGAGRLQEAGNIVASWVAVPSTATSTGKVGQMAADGSWLYTCTAANTWRRVAHASW